MSRFNPQGHFAAFHTRRVVCVVCGKRRFEHETATGAEMTAETMALVGITRDESIVCKEHVDAAERELNDAAEALELDSDPTFAEVCDARDASYRAHAMQNQGVELVLAAVA